MPKQIRMTNTQICLLELASHIRPSLALIQLLNFIVYILYLYYTCFKSKHFCDWDYSFSCCIRRYAYKQNSIKLLISLFSLAIRTISAPAIGTFELQYVALFLLRRFLISHLFHSREPFGNKRQSKNHHHTHSSIIDHRQPSHRHTVSLHVIPPKIKLIHINTHTKGKKHV